MATLYRASRASGHCADYALLLLLATLWGASYTFIKVGVESIPPITLIAARTTIAAVVLVGILRWRHIAIPTGRALWRRFLLQACLNSVIPFTLIAWAEQSVDAGRATILNSSAPTTHPHARIGGHDIAGLPEGSDRRRGRRCLSWRDACAHDLDRPCVRRCWRGDDGHSGETTIARGSGHPLRAA